MRNIIIATALFLCVAVCTYAQESDVRGTVIVTGHSTTKLVIATESRNVGKAEEMCKILVLDSKTVFTSAGIGAHANQNVTYWNAFAQALYTFEKAKPSKDSTRLKSAAVSFGERFTNEVNQALKIDNKGSLALIQGNENTVLTGMSGLRGGLNGSRFEWRGMCRRLRAKIVFMAVAYKVSMPVEMTIGELFKELTRMAEHWSPEYKAEFRRALPDTRSG